MEDDPIVLWERPTNIGVVSPEGIILIRSIELTF